MKPAIFFASTFLVLVVLGSFVVDDAQTAVYPQSSDADSELLKQIGGAVYGVAIRDDLAYVGIGHRLEIFDVSDPAQPASLGQTEPLAEIIEHLALYNDYALAATLSGLQIIDVSNPAAPVLLTTYSLPGRYVNEFVVSGNYAFIAKERDYDSTPGGGGLHILDISDPQNASETATYAPGGTPLTFTLVNGYIYGTVCPPSDDPVCSVKNVIVNVTNPANPIEEQVEAAIGNEQWAGKAQHLYKGVESMFSISIYSLADPANPVLVDTLSEGAKKLDVIDDHLFAYQLNGVKVYGLTDPAAPALKGQYTLSDFWGPGNVAADGRYAYLAFGTGGLRIIDLQTAGLPEAGSYSLFTQVKQIARVEPFVYMLDFSRRLYVLDVSDPLQPEIVKLHTSSQGNLAQMHVLGNDVFLAGPGGFEIVNVSQSANPTTRSTYNTQGWNAQQLRFKGDFALQAIGYANHPSLDVIDISNRNNPTYVTSVGSTAHSATGLEIVGETAFLAENSSISTVDSQLTILNVTNPAAPAVIKTHTVPNPLQGVVILNNHAYLANGANGVRIIDVSNPQQPQEAGFYTIPDAVGYTVMAQNGFLYVEGFMADGGRVREIVDVSTPQAPQKVGVYAYTGELTVDEVVYVPDGHDGLSIYRQESDDAPDDPGSEQLIFLPLIVR